MPIVHRDSDVSDWLIDTAAAAAVLFAICWRREHG